MRKIGLIALVAMALSAGCDGETVVDAGSDGGRRDAGGGDAGGDDAGMEDAEVPPVDAGMDAAMGDAGMSDAGSDGGPLCGNDMIDAPEQCDGTDLGTATCESVLGTGATGTVTCSNCMLVTSACQLCGDSMIQGTEECDNTNFGAETCETQLDVGATGLLGCNGCVIDSSGCQLCGNATIEGTEQCDGTNLGTATCATVPGGFMTGTLACNACGYDTSACSTAAQPSAAGQIVISEIMPNPNAFPDADGEWFEVHNPGGADLNLLGCTVTGTGATTDTFTISSNVIVPAGGYATFSVMTSAAGAPGFTSDYQWVGGATGFNLGNTSDGITIACGTTTIDAVLYDSTAFPILAGVSATLDSTMLTTTANDSGANWCTGVSAIGSTADLGTPDAANDPCSFPVGFCRLQSPTTIDAAGGDVDDVYGRVYVAGITDRTAMTDPHPRVIAEVGLGPDGTDPATDTTWTWTRATPNTAYGPGTPSHEPNNDEYQGTITSPVVAAGTFDYAYRFSGDTGRTWVYCDSGAAGSSDGYSAANAGTLNVITPPPTITAIVPGTIDVLTGGGTGILTIQLSGPTLTDMVITISSSVPLSVAVPLTVTVPAGQSSIAFRVRGAAVGTSAVMATSGTSSAMAMVNVVATAPAPAAGDLIVNEITYDPPGATTTPTDLSGDANCNGAWGQQADEHFEMVNVSDHPIQLLGVAMWDNTTFTSTTVPLPPPRFVFPSFVLGPGEPLILIGQTGGTVTTAPWCAGAAPAAGAGEPFRLGDGLAFAGGDISLGNGGDTITLTTAADRAATMIVQQAYGDAVADNQGYTRSPDITGAFIPYTSAPGHATDRVFSPNTRLDGRPFAAATAP